MDTLILDKGFLKQEIAPYIQMILSEYPAVSIEHRFEDFESQHLLIVHNQTFDLPFYELIEKIITAFYNNEANGTLSIVNTTRRQRKIIQSLPIVATYNINTTFSEKEKKIPLATTSTSQFTQTNKWLYIGLGALIGVLLMIVLYFGLSSDSQNIETTSPIEIEKALEESEEKKQNRTNNSSDNSAQEQIFAQIQSLEKQIKEQNEVIKEKDVKISDVTLALERKEPNSNLSAIIPATIVRASDLSEGIILSGDGQRITISNLEVNGLNADFKYQQNGKTQSGKIRFDFEVVQLNGLGTGTLFNNETGKIVMNIMQSNGKMIVLKEE